MLIVLILMSLLACFYAFLAGKNNGIMDTVESHFEKSIYFNNPKYPKPFYGSKSDTSNNKYDKNGTRIIWFKVFGFKILKPVAWTDHWHQAKSKMLIYLALSTMVFSLLTVALEFEYHISQRDSWLFRWAFLLGLLYRGSFGFGFWLYHDHILLKK